MRPVGHPLFLGGIGVSPPCHPGGRSMAIAKIQKSEVQAHGDTLYEPIIIDYSRYAGPPGTSWHLVDSFNYQFRTCADEVAEMIEAVRAKKTTIQVACNANPVLRAVLDREVAFLEDCGDVLPSTTDARRLHACQELPVGSLFKSMLGGKNPYWSSEDEFRLQAVCALDYPEWADVETDGGKQMDRDFVQGFIRIEEGHDLAELWRWLERRQAGRSSLARRK